MLTTLKEVTIEVRPSTMLPGEVGLFAARDIKKGERIVDFGTPEEDFITREEFRALPLALQRKIQAFMFGRPKGYLIDRNLDFNALPTSYYSNHSCDGNMGFDEDSNFIAIRDISKGEELAYDYGLVESNPDFSMACACGSGICRGTITGNDWRDSAFQARRGAYLHPDLRSLR